MSISRACSEQAAEVAAVHVASWQSAYRGILPVLVRPALRKQHGLTVAEIETVLTDIAQHAIVLEPAHGSAAPDPGDQFLWDLLAARPDLLLITGDRALLSDAAMRTRVLSPRDFVEG